MLKIMEQKGQYVFRTPFHSICCILVALSRWIYVTDWSQIVEDEIALCFAKFALTYGYIISACEARIQNNKKNKQRQIGADGVFIYVTVYL